MDGTALTPTEQTEATTHSKFQLAYDGPAVADGTMDVRQLAPALVALEVLVQRSNELLNGDKSTIKLRVVAGFDKGSFDINFLLDHIVKDPSAAMLPALSSLNASQLLDITLGTYEKAKGVLSGVTRLYKAVRGERPTETRPSVQANTTILVFGNNNVITTDSATARLYNDDGIRASVRTAAEPLLRDGFERMAVKRDDQLVETLERSDVGQSPSIDLTVNVPEKPKDDDPRRDIWVKVLKPNFDGGRWTFSDGAGKFGADIEDKTFQARVDSREQGFYAGDAFFIRLRTSQHLDKNGGLATRNVVERVLEYRQSPRQQRLSPSEA